MHDYFFYGTLIDPDVRHLVLGSSVEGLLIEPATVRGWAALYVLGGSYPILVRRAGAVTSGMLAGPIEDAMAACLAAYEDDGYRVETLTVRTADGARRAAQAFVPNRTMRHDGRIWRFETWQSREKAAFLRRLQGWRPPLAGPAAALPR